MDDVKLPSAEEVKKNRGGRPRKEIDLDRAEKLAAIMCTMEEIAYVLDVSVDTLRRNKRFCEIYKKGQEEGRASLRRKQFERALSGNVTMLIWLGKQYLGQKDKIEQNVSGIDGGAPINVSLTDEEIAALLLRGSNADKTGRAKGTNQ